jgi:hypothetical protein
MSPLVITLFFSGIVVFLVIKAALTLGNKGQIGCLIFLGIYLVLGAPLLYWKVGQENVTQELNERPYTALAERIRTLLNQSLPSHRDPNFATLRRSYVIYTTDDVYEVIHNYFDFAGHHDIDDEIRYHDGILYSQSPHALLDFPINPYTIIVVTMSKIGDADYTKTGQGLIGKIPSTKTIVRNRYKLLAVDARTGNLALHNELEDAPFKGNYVLGPIPEGRVHWNDIIKWADSIAKN